LAEELTKMCFSVRHSPSSYFSTCTVTAIYTLYSNYA